MKRRLELLAGFIVLPAMAALIVAWQLGFIGVPTAPAGCADPCVVTGDQYDTATEEWVLYLSHCPDLESLPACEPPLRVTVTSAEWKNWRMGMRWTGPMEPK